MHDCLLGAQKLTERLPLPFAPATCKAVTKTPHLFENQGHRDANQRKTIEKQHLKP